MRLPASPAAGIRHLGSALPAAVTRPPDCLGTGSSAAARRRCPAQTDCSAVGLASSASAVSGSGNRSAAVGAPDRRRRAACGVGDSGFQALAALRFFLDALGRFLREGDDVLGLFLGDARQLRQLRRLQERQVVVGQEAFLDERFDHFVGDAGNLPEPALGPLDALVQLVVRHDLDVPADQLARQADVLAAPADGQRQLIFLDQHDGPAQPRIEEHFLDRWPAAGRWGS